MAQKWRGVLTLQGVESGDHRMLERVTWRDLPLTLRLQTEDFGAHDGASPVGRIDVIAIDGELVVGEGEFSESPEGQLAAQWVGERVLRGVSVDPGAVEYVEELVDPATSELVSLEQVYDTWDAIEAAQITGDDAEAARLMEWLDGLYYRVRFTQYEIAAATLVATPAFGDATIELVSDADTTDESDDTADDDEAADETSELGKKRKRKDEMSASPARERLSALLDRRGSETVAAFSPGRMIAAGEAQRFDSSPASALAAALGRRASGPAVMRAAYFEPIDATQPVKFTITDDGRIMGHLFTWNACHRSFLGRCERPERQSEFPDFHTGETALDNGERLRTGVITFADLHAPDGQLTADELTTLMEHTGVQLGPVRLHADAFGVQACGQVFDDVDPTQVARALAGYPSGDWRKINGTWRLFGLHVVNTPGYPMYEEADGAPLRLVASMAQTVGTAAEQARDTLDSDCDDCDDEHEARRLSAAAMADLAQLDTAMAVRSRLVRS
jgi:hypothetical protein